MKYVLTLFAALFLSLGFAQESFPLTVTDALDRETTFERPPERVVALYDNSLGFAAMAGVRPVGHISTGAEQFFEGGESIPSVASEDGIDYELVAELEPDLILIEPVPELVAALEEIAPVYVYEPAEASLELMRANVLAVANIVANVEVAEANLARFDDRLAAYAAMVEDVPRREIVPAYLWDADAGEWLVYGSDQWFSCAELIPIFAACGAEETLFRTSIEAVLELDPEWIWLGADDIEDASDAEALLAKLAENPLWNELSAVQNDQVILHPDISSLTINTHTEALDFIDVIVPLLFPDLFPTGLLTDEQVQETLAENE